MCVWCKEGVKWGKRHEIYLFEQKKMMREIGAGQGEGKFCYAGCFFFKGQPHTSSRWKRRLTGQEAVGSSGPFKGTPDYGLPTLERVGEEGGGFA